MKTQGFTLIELLAVIVILAIIALIATPIVLGIIEDTKESAQIRSAEMYLKGVANAVMKENLEQEGNFKPTECTITSEGNLDCDDKEGILEVEVDGEKPKNGTITFEEGKIKEVTLNYTNSTIVKNDEGNLVYNDEQSGSGFEEETLAPGLYKTDGTFVSWEQLTSKEYVTLSNNCCIQEQAILTVKDGELSSACDMTGCCGDIMSSTYLSGKLIVDKSVTGIGWGAFYECYNLTSVILPDTVTFIQNEAFYDCDGLTSITIPNVTQIGEWAFRDCSKLTSVTFLDSIKYIDQMAFQWCENLTSITMPNSVISIWHDAFRGCALKTINYKGTKAEWNSIEFGDDWNGKSQEITVHCTDGDIIIPAY